jgi:hypothetical protein
MNLKLFGQRNGGRYVEHNLDGLMRGDLLSRMQAHGQSVQNAIARPNEVRSLENLPPLPNGDELMIKGQPCRSARNRRAGNATAR